MKANKLTESEFDIQRLQTVKVWDKQYVQNV